MQLIISKEDKAVINAFTMSYVGPWVGGTNFDVGGGHLRLLNNGKRTKWVQLTLKFVAILEDIKEEFDHEDSRRCSRVWTLFN